MSNTSPPAILLLKLGNLRELEVEVDILSQDVGTVQVGDDAEIAGPAIGPNPSWARSRPSIPPGSPRLVRSASSDGEVRK